MTKTCKKTETLTVVEKRGPVALVTISNEAFTTWAVRGPDYFNRIQIWTQPDEKSARSFADRLFAVLARKNSKLKPLKGEK